MKPLCCSTGESVAVDAEVEPSLLCLIVLVAERQQETFIDSQRKHRHPKQSMLEKVSCSAAKRVGLATCWQDRTASRLPVQTRKESAKPKLEEPFAVHGLRVLTQSEEDKHPKSESNLNPAVVVHVTSRGYQHNVLPLGTMNEVPAVWEQRRRSRIDEKDVELKWYEGDYECY